MADSPSPAGSQNSPQTAPSAPPAAPATPAAPEPQTVTVTVPGASGPINVGGRIFNAVEGEVELAIHEVADFLQRVPGAVAGSKSDPSNS